MRSLTNRVRTTLRWWRGAKTPRHELGLGSTDDPKSDIVDALVGHSLSSGDDPWEAA
jgi:hypothetical protein